jgi:hypothetical protein
MINFMKGREKSRFCFSGLNLFDEVPYILFHSPQEIIDDSVKISSLFCFRFKSLRAAKGYSNFINQHMPRGSSKRAIMQEEYEIFKVYVSVDIDDPYLVFGQLENFEGGLAIGKRLAVNINERFQTSAGVPDRKLAPVPLALSTAPRAAKEGKVLPVRSKETKNRRQEIRAALNNLMSPKCSFERPYNILGQLCTVRLEFKSMSDADRFFNNLPRTIRAHLCRGASGPIRGGVLSDEKRFIYIKQRSEMHVINSVSAMLDSLRNNQNLLHAMSNRIANKLEYYGCTLFSWFKWSKSAKIEAGIAKIWLIQGASTRALSEWGSHFENAVATDNPVRIDRFEQRLNRIMLRTGG